MAVNVKKTQFMIFYTRGKDIDLRNLDVIFDSNDPNDPNPDPNLIHKLERVYDNHADENMKITSSLEFILMNTSTLINISPKFL
jgi:hypothetical protein